MNVFEAVSAFYAHYTGEKRTIGRSAEGREIYAFFVGEHGNEGICQYAMHAREWITAYLSLYHIVRGVARGGVWFVPLVNPDGALIVQEGLSSVRDGARRARIERMNADLSLWKANADCVDLNVNFDARWGTGVRNRRTPWSENYIGEYPFSAPESKALKAFTEAVTPRFTLSFHTKGEEIYWRFFQSPEHAERDRAIGERLSASTGYPLCEAWGSAGGYKDWCVEQFGIPAYTVECGSDSLAHPLGLDSLEDIIRACGDCVRDFKIS